MNSLTPSYFCFFFFTVVPIILRLHNWYTIVKKIRKSRSCGTRNGSEKQIYKYTCIGETQRKISSKSVDYTTLLLLATRYRTILDRPTFLTRLICFYFFADLKPNDENEKSTFNERFQLLLIEIG